MRPVGGERTTAEAADEEKNKRAPEKTQTVFEFEWQRFHLKSLRKFTIPFRNVSDVFKLCRFQVDDVCINGVGILILCGRFPSVAHAS